MLRPLFALLLMCLAVVCAWRATGDEDASDRAWASAVVAGLSLTGMASVAFAASVVWAVLRDLVWKI